MNAELLKTKEMMAIMNMGKDLAVNLLRKHGVEPIDLGSGRGRGLRWHKKAVKAVCDTLYAEASAKRKKPSPAPQSFRPVFGRSVSELFEELNSKRALQ